MLNKKYIQNNVLLITIVLLLFSIPNFSMGKDDAFQLFKQKKYQEALPLFNELRSKNPDDNSLCYYYGVCLSETNQFGEEALSLLLKAESSDQPVTITIYIGKNYHALNDFKNAKSYYLIFNQKASNKEKKSYNLSNLMNLCDKRINPFPPVKVKSDSIKGKSGDTENDNLSSKSIDSIKSAIDTVRVTELPLEIPSELNDTMINFIITSEIIYTKIYQFRTYNGKLNFINGWKNADKLSQMIHLTDSLRNEYRKTLSSEARSQISNKVIELENLILKTKALSDSSYFKADEVELSYWKQATEDEKLKLIEENDSIKNADKLKQSAKTIPPTPVDPLASKDSVTTDTISQKNNELEDEPHKTNQIVFKVQIGKYNTELPESTKKLFKKISVLRKIDQYTDEKKFTIYTIGELTNLKDAVKLQDQIRQESVKDAFVIAIKDGKRIPLNEALNLLKQ
jgi:hypothetical protein